MPTAAARHDVAIRRFTEIADRELLVPAIDAIFFASSATKVFASAAKRDAFRERWLGRYLMHAPEWAYLALAGDRVVGYLVGTVEDPCRPGASANLQGFSDAAALAADYPAHLHVNLASGYRNRGIGARLVATFAADAARAGAAGVHVVTGASSRNVGFYRRNGFRELARADLEGRPIVLLGRRLRSQETA